MGTGYGFPLFRPGFCLFRQRPGSLSSFSMKWGAPVAGPVYMLSLISSSYAPPISLLLNLSPLCPPALAA